MTVISEDRRDEAMTPVNERDRANQSALYPCTYTQMRIWYSQMLDPQASHWNVAMRWRLTGPVRDSTIADAWQILTDRHEVLRTGIEEFDGIAHQRVWASLKARVDVVDLSRLDATQQASAIDTIARREARTPLPLDQTPLARLQLLRVSEDEAFLLTTFHNIIVDGTSVGVLIREFGQIASALEKGRQPDLADVPVQLVDYALWQADMLATGAFEESRAFWAERLAQLPRFELPTDRRRPAVLTHNGEIRTILLPRAIGEKISAFCQRRQCSVYHIAASSLSAVLVRRTGMTDVVFGSQAACRDEPELEGMVGAIINTIAHRFDASGDPFMVDYIEHCRMRTTTALQHQHLPFNFVIEALKPKRDASRNLLYSMTLDGQAAHIDGGRMRDASFDGFGIEAMPSFSAGAATDIGFFMVGRAEGWRISCAVNTDLFDLTTADQIMRDWAQAIETLIETDGQIRLSQVPTAPADKFEVSDVKGIAADNSVAGDRKGDVAARRLATPSEREVAGVGGAAVRETVARIWGDILALDHIEDGTDFFDAGGTSLAALRMISRVNRELETKLALTSLLQAPSFDAFTRIIAGLQGHGVETADGPVANPAPSKAAAGRGRAAAHNERSTRHRVLTPDRPPFAIDASAAGKTPVLAMNNGYAYLLIDRAMSENRALINVPVGTEDDTAFASAHSYDALVTRIADRIRQQRPHGPYVLACYCALGTLAASVVRRLESEGETVALLVTLNARPPGYLASLGRVAKLVRRRRMLGHAVSNFGVLMNKLRRGDVTPSVALEHYGFIRKLKIVPALRRVGVFSEVPPEYDYIGGLDFFDQAYRARAAAPPETGKLACDIAVIETSDFMRGRFFPDGSGWIDFTNGRLTETIVEGKHKDIFGHASATVIGQTIEDILSEMEHRRAGVADRQDKPVAAE